GISWERCDRAGRLPPTGASCERAGYLLMTTDVDFWLPDVSVAVAVTVCWPDGRGPVDHHTVPVSQVAAPLQATDWISVPSPKIAMLVRPTLSVAVAWMSRLLPVHALFAGLTIVTVGSVVSPPPGGGVTV